MSERRPGVCARLEFLFAFYFEEGADLGKNVRGRAGIHAPQYRGGHAGVTRCPLPDPGVEGGESSRSLQSLLISSGAS